MPLRAAGDDPAPYPIGPAPLFPAIRLSQLPEIEGDKAAKKAFKSYPLGYFHIDIAEVRTEKGKLHLFVAVDRTSKYSFARLKEKVSTTTAREFLDELVQTLPYRIHTVLTDNGIQFADLPKNRGKPMARSSL